MTIGGRRALKAEIFEILGNAPVDLESRKVLQEILKGKSLKELLQFRDKVAIAVERFNDEIMMMAVPDDGSELFEELGVVTNNPCIQLALRDVLSSLILSAHIDLDHLCTDSDRYCCSAFDARLEAENQAWIDAAEANAKATEEEHRLARVIGSYTTHRDSPESRILAENIAMYERSH